MPNASYIEEIKKLHELTDTQFWLWYMLMHHIRWSEWPTTLQQIVHDWGQQYGTQSYDIRAGLISGWLKTLD